MFKSSQTLRLAAEMRALARVAAPWRQARTTWFDGTPESIAARLAATDRVLVAARAGYTQAHLALEREAAAARAELTAAQHRLLVDFLDDGARAFKGSRRVADETTGFGLLGPGYEHFGPDDLAEHDDYLHRHDYHTEPDDLHGLEHRLHVHDYDDDDPARYSSRRTAAFPEEAWVNYMESGGDPDDHHLDALLGDWRSRLSPEQRERHQVMGGDDHSFSEFSRYLEDPHGYTASRRTANNSPYETNDLRGGPYVCKHCGEEIETRHAEGDWVHPDVWERTWEGEYPKDGPHRDHAAEPEDDEDDR